MANGIITGGVGGSGTIAEFLTHGLFLQVVYTYDGTIEWYAKAVPDFIAQAPFTATPILLYDQAGNVLEAQNGYFLQDQDSPKGTPIAATAVKTFIAEAE